MLVKVHQQQNLGGNPRELWRQRKQRYSYKQVLDFFFLLSEMSCVKTNLKGKAKQTTQLHPGQLRRKSCPGWDSNPQHFMNYRVVLTFLSGLY